ncbi:MAG: hypothetical protein H7Y13_04945 [Sphingobacteriaceae bacterium]|nr:hypothetical protein [Sphingobacteriaceae bacterium]
MKTRTFIIISTLTAFFFGSCNSTPDLKEDEVYTIINEIIADDSLQVDRACWKFVDIPLTTEYEKEFTKQDIEFVSRQKDQFKNITIKPNKLKWYRRRNKAFVNTTIDTVCNQGILYHISFPLISADRKKVIIEFKEDCNCMLGGQGGKDLYEKKNGAWVRTKGFDHWISDNTTLRNKEQLLVTNSITLFPSPHGRHAQRKL